MPNKPFDFNEKEEFLSFEQLFVFVKTCIDAGIDKIRISGGEPLLRKGLDEFIGLIHSYAPSVDLAITTNGYLLKEQLSGLIDAGLKRINFSLDSINQQTVQKIAQKDVLHSVLESLEQCLKSGIKVKINMVPLRGINDGEIVQMLEFAISKNIPIRFIEYMSNTHAHSGINGLNGREILTAIKQKYDFEKVGIINNSPAFNYKLENGYEFGLIDPHKDDFCKNCNRLRLTANGELIPCLYFEDALSIKEAVQNNDIQKANEILQLVLQNKPEKNKWSHNATGDNISNRAFFETGG
jgi:cyclic pyranopterin phosphate synthase